MQLSCNDSIQTTMQHAKKKKNKKKKKPNINYLLYISFLLPISALLFLGVALTRAHDVTRGAFCLPKAVGHLSITGLRQ
jgi:hypothetical protein